MDSFQQERDRFAAHYAGLSDGELLEFAARSWELSDSAWDALEDELDRRHLELPVPEPVPQISSAEKRDLVILRRFRDLPEALLAKGKLESAGVPCFLPDDNMARILVSNYLGGVKLLVDTDDFAEALRLLNEPAPEEPDTEDAE